MHLLRGIHLIWICVCVYCVVYGLHEICEATWFLNKFIMAMLCCTRLPVVDRTELVVESLKCYYTFILEQRKSGIHHNQKQLKW